MTDILFSPRVLKKHGIRSLNTDTLHETIAQDYKERIQGISTSPDGVRFHLAEIKPGDRTRLRAYMQAHDPSQLSAAQQRQKAISEAYMRFISADFEALRGLQPTAQFDAILTALNDIQLLMKGAAHG